MLFRSNRYNNIQKEISERFSNPPKITNSCISRYNELQHDKSIKKIITWNVQELWWYCYKGNKINNIINYIVNSDSDVICLQEVGQIIDREGITVNQAEKISNFLGKEYQYKFAPTKKKWKL